MDSASPTALLLDVFAMSLCKRVLCSYRHQGEGKETSGLGGMLPASRPLSRVESSRYCR